MLAMFVGSRPSTPTSLPSDFQSKRKSQILSWILMPTPNLFLNSPFYFADEPVIYETYNKTDVEWFDSETFY